MRKLCSNRKASTREDYGQYIAPHYRRRRRAYDAEEGYSVADVDVTELEALF